MKRNNIAVYYFLTLSIVFLSTACSKNKELVKDEAPQKIVVIPEQDKLYDQALKNYEKGAYEDSLSGFERIINEYAGTSVYVPSLYFAGHSSFLVNRNRQAISYLHSFIEYASNNTSEANRLKRARLVLIDAYSIEQRWDMVSSVAQELLRNNHTPEIMIRAKNAWGNALVEMGIFSKASPIISDVAALLSNGVLSINESERKSLSAHHSYVKAKFIIRSAFSFQKETSIAKSPKKREKQIYEFVEKKVNALVEAFHFFIEIIKFDDVRWHSESVNLASHAVGKLIHLTRVPPPPPRGLSKAKAYHFTRDSRIMIAQLIRKNLGIIEEFLHIVDPKENNELVKDYSSLINWAMLQTELGLYDKK